jgi:uncharacterized protein (TIGR02284 family)
MLTATTTVEDTISYLVEVCHDGHSGFEAAADAMTDATLKMELLRYSRQSAQFITDLEQTLRTLGQTPPTHGTISGALRRGWMHLARVITRGDEHAILHACKSAQDAAVMAYSNALATPLPPDLQELIAAQHRVILGIQSRIESLCNTAKTS